MAKTNLEWYVFIEDPNKRIIEKYNIFEHGSFFKSLLTLKKDYLKAKKLYIKKLREENNINRYTRLPATLLSEIVAWDKEYKTNTFKSGLDLELHYYFWSKSEWEIILTSWPPYINKEEATRIAQEDVAYYTSVNLSTDLKIDVYEQIAMNYSIFIDYVWEHFICSDEFVSYPEEKEEDEI